MRILFIDTTTDSSEIGGGHLILPELMKGLTSRGHEVHLVMGAQANSKLRDLIIDSNAVVHIAPWKKKLPVSKLTLVFNDWINSLNPDVYVISSSAAIGWLVLPILNPKIPAFTIGHNNEDTFFMPVRHYRAFISRAIGVSEEICNVYIQSCGLKEDKVKWIPYGVPAAKEVSVSSPNGVLRIVYVGRIEEKQKRVSDLVKVALELYKKNIQFKLNIVGDGPEVDNVRKSLENLIKLGMLELHGWKGKEAIISMMRQSDVFILTSAYEGFSIALTEAMANGCCPIVTDIRSGNQQMIKNGENGFLIRLGDIDSYIRTISEIAVDRSKLQQLRQSAFEKGIEYSTQRMAENYEEDFKKAIYEAGITPRINNFSYPILPSCVSRYPMWIRIIKAKISKKQIV